MSNDIKLIPANVGYDKDKGWVTKMSLMMAAMRPRYMAQIVATAVKGLT